MNSQAATIKIAKLPRSFTATEKSAINEAEALGQLMAMAKEAKDDDSGSGSNQVSKKPLSIPKVLANS
jgi:hypothetical protein